MNSGWSTNFLGCSSKSEHQRQEDGDRIVEGEARISSDSDRYSRSCFSVCACHSALKGVLPTPQHFCSCASRPVIQWTAALVAPATPRKKEDADESACLVGKLYLWS